jgi:hypothetical protein
MVTEQVPVPVQAPLQPANTDPAAAALFSVTTLPEAKGAEQVAPQLIPAGLEVTVPVPVPVFATVRVWAKPKVAVTDLAALRVTEQAPVPAQAPLHPVKTEPAAAVLLRVTTVPDAKGAEQVAPQLMPAGVEVTVPVPVPAFTTVRVWLSLKVAATDLAALMVTVQAPVPVQAPLHPVNTDPAAAVLFRVTTVPEP